VGAAVAVGNLLRLDEQRMNWAIGLAASQASGFRASHGTMTAHFRPGHAARSGVWAALLAARDFTCDLSALEAEHGFLDVYASHADAARALDGLGEHFELLANAYKPYPCGIVIHPTLDACLDIAAQAAPGATPAQVTLKVHPLALKLTGVRTPATTLESHVSLYHWAAAALLRRRAGLAEMRPDCIADPAVAALRSRIVAVADPGVGRGEAIVEAVYSDGARLRSHVTQARGSVARPMTDDELDAKFREQALQVLEPGRVESLIHLCRDVAMLRDVGGQVSAAWLA
jgi:2-methylcitrate dehydratase PrpD